MCIKNRRQNSIWFSLWIWSDLLSRSRCRSTHFFLFSSLFVFSFSFLFFFFFLFSTIVVIHEQCYIHNIYVCIHRCTYKYIHAPHNTYIEIHIESRAMYMALTIYSYVFNIYVYRIYILSSPAVFARLFIRRVHYNVIVRIADGWWWLRWWWRLQRWC